LKIWFNKKTYTVRVLKSYIAKVKRGRGISGEGRTPKSCEKKKRKDMVLHANTDISTSPSQHSE